MNNEKALTGGDLAVHVLAKVRGPIRQLADASLVLNKDKGAFGVKSECTDT